MKGEQEMGVKEKYVLYEMLIHKSFVRFARGNAKGVNPFALHDAILTRTNYILDAIGESVTNGELFDVICQEVSVA